MLLLAQKIERFWWRKQPPKAWLQPLAALYQWFNQRNLQQRDQRAVPPPLPVVFVGNITVGGSGKSPFVMVLAQALKQRGAKPVIVCRGDGGRMQQPQQVSADADPAEVGDEACMMARASDIPVIAGRDRVAGAALAASLGDLMLLDDGLQYRQLARMVGRSCEVVLLPAAGLGNGGLLPIGPLREPVSALQRADIVIISGEEQHEWSLPLDGVPCFHWSHPVAGIADAMALSRGVIPPTRLHLVTAIARPDRVVRSLRALGFDVGGQSQFSDHYRYRKQDVDRLCAQPDAVVTTMKDAVKLYRMWPKGRSLWVCHHHAVIDGALVDQVLVSLGCTDGNFGSDRRCG
ncbi:MAG: tetraacyldisaccharide 4'-kinase [Mariprofundales bacterium]